MSPELTPPRAAALLRSLHEQVESAAARLGEVHRERLQCRRGCAACCVDDLSVFAVEAARIEAEAPEVLEGRPGPAGACAFLDAEGACRVYAQRPYVCRTQGLPLRWLEEQEQGAGAAAAEVVERRDICELNEPSPASGLPGLLELPAEACWPLGPVEEQLQALQAAFEPETPLRRVRLRELFPASGLPRSS